MRRAISPDDVLVQPEALAVREEAGRLILQAPHRQAHFQLTGTSQRIWEQLRRPVTFRALCDQMADEFAVERAECEAQIGTFLSDLLQHGLIEVMPEAPGPVLLRRHYLELMKRALVNLIYTEHEMRMDYLAKHGLSGVKRDDHRIMRDIRYRYPEEYAARVAWKELGRLPGHKPPAHAFFSHTMIGLRRLDNIEYCARQVFARGIPGDFLEAGVCQGGATIFMRALQVAFDETERRVWVADSFEGLPPPTSDPDRHSGFDFTEPRMPWLAISLQHVQDNFRTYGLLDGGVRFLPGWFADTLPGAPVERLAILRVDADLYQSTREVLEALYDRVVPGGYVIVDDYGAFLPCRQAVDSFREERGITARLRRIDCDGVFWRKDA
jgi:O-methyltransferase